ncbi:hypothetical protein ACFYTQ_17480 [Nocardia sp. NPDC004068]|uniref:hypothetical protein n=1 Tax=Nocardia sp. NPDC004068 TaxID=3364303 RepID=UPI0036A8F258
MTSLRLEVLHDGRTLTLFGAVIGGACRARDWLASCDERTKAQFYVRFERLTTIGYLRSPEEMRRLHCPVSPSVSEIKTRSGHRLYVIREGNDWIATHGARKPPDRKVCEQAARAIEIWKEAHTQ